MNDMGPLLASIVASVFAFLGIWLVQRNAKKANKTSDTQTIIDQLQEDRQQRLENRLENAEALFRISSDYVLALRYHIAEGHPPPPPPYPAEMTRGLGGDR
jgi:hypothetical protein